jgi:hypothetical protein
MEGAGGVSVIEARFDGVTVSVLALLLTVPSVAVIVVLATRWPVASPLLVIMATAGLLDTHVNVTSGIGVPLISLAVATNCWV